MPKHLAFTALLSLCAASTFAQTTDIQANPAKSAYLQDGRGVVARSGFGLCWRTGTWTPADAIPGCDGELTLPIAKPTAPPLTAPVPVAQSPVTAAKRCDFAVTLGNDEAFAFNKAVLSGAAKARIDTDVMSKLESCAKVDIVLVTGHTDRLGSQQYNQKLSEKRANAVAVYLKSKGVASEIDTLGAGKTQAIKSCSDKLPRKKLVECLAPNRRVAIEGRGLAKQ